MSFLIKMDAGGYVTSVEMKFDNITTRKIDTVFKQKDALFFSTKERAEAILMLLNIKGNVVEVTP